MTSATRHAGLVALLGRPNVGKSSLLNRLVGEKVAIVTPKPQTTRSRILGVVTRPEGQVGFIDTPGVHPAKGVYNRSLVEVAWRTLQEVDLVVFMLELSRTAKPDVDAENRAILARLSRMKRPVLLAINKIDQAPKPLLLPMIEQYARDFTFAEVIPISAKTGEGVELLLASALARLPQVDPLFNEDMLTDQTERTLVSEYIREQLFRHCREEVPYSSAVRVDLFDESEREPRHPTSKAGTLQGLVRIAASIVVQRESQKAIAIGKRGQMLKAIGTEARKQIEGLLGTHVYLDLRVRVDPRWTEHPGERGDPGAR